MKKINESNIETKRNVKSYIIWSPLDNNKIISFIQDFHNVPKSPFKKIEKYNKIIELLKTNYFSDKEDETPKEGHRRTNSSLEDQINRKLSDFSYCSDFKTKVSHFQFSTPLNKKTIESEDNTVSDNSFNDNTIINNNSHYSSLKSLKNYDSGGIPKHNGDDECDFFSDD